MQCSSKLGVRAIFAIVVGWFMCCSPSNAYAQGPTSSLMRGPGFAGEWMWQDNAASTPLIYLRARTYTPSEGRFLQRDPFAGVMGAPQTQNRTYYTNNPANNTDPTGYASLSAGLPNFDHLDLGPQLGSGGDKLVYRVAGAGRIGPQVIGLSYSPELNSGLNQLLGEKQALSFLDRHRIPTMDFQVGTYRGQPAFVSNDLLLHSRMLDPRNPSLNAFDNPRWVARQSVLTQASLRSLINTGNLLADCGIYCLDYQGGFCINGNKQGSWLINDPKKVGYLNDVAPSYRDLFVRQTRQPQIDLEQKLARGLSLRSGSPMMRTGTMVDIAYTVHDMLDLANRTQDDPRYRNDPRPMPQKMWEKGNNELHCMMFGPCLYRNYEPPMTVQQ